LTPKTNLRSHENRKNMQKQVLKIMISGLIPPWKVMSNNQRVCERVGVTDCKPTGTLTILIGKHRIACISSILKAKG